jgi:hypothetical protein
MGWLEALPELVLKCILGYVDYSVTILCWSHTNRRFFYSLLPLAQRRHRIAIAVRRSMNIYIKGTVPPSAAIHRKWRWIVAWLVLPSNEAILADVSALCTNRRFFTAFFR